MTPTAPACLAPMPEAPMHLGRADHLWQLDVLRAAAILLVFAYHLLKLVAGPDALGFNAAGWFAPAAGREALWAFYPYALGNTGVILFFVLSGFCIHHSYLQSAPRARFSFAAFMWRRAWRIYPAYLVALALALLLEGRTVAGWWQGRGDVLYHLLLAHNLKGDYFYSLNPAFWSLGVEWQFYLAFPLFLALRRRLGAAATVLAALGVSVAFQLALHAAAADRPAFAGDRRYLAWVNFPLVTWVHWCWGALAAEARHRGRPAFRPPVGMLLAYWLVLVAASVYQPTHPAAMMGWGLGYAMLLEKYLLGRDRSAKFDSSLASHSPPPNISPRPPSAGERWLIPVGLCSYSLYLLHQPLMARASEWLAARGLAGPEWLGLTVGGLLVLAALVGLAWASFRLVELPGVRLGSRWWKRWCARGAKAATPAGKSAALPGGGRSCDAARGGAGDGASRRS